MTSARQTDVRDPGERGLIAAVRRVNQAKRPERSVALRVATLVSVMVGIAAVGFSRSASTPDVLVALVLLPVGAYVSHRRKEESNLALKGLLALAAMFALWRFFGQLQSSTTVDDARQPLANLFIAVQVIHGFDLPRRRDLGFSVISSVLLVALAAVDVRETWFLGVLIAWLLAAGVAGVFTQRSAAHEEGDELAEEPRRNGWTAVWVRAVPSPAARASSTGVARRGRHVRPVAATVATALLVGLTVFLFLPRSSAPRLGGLPFDGFGGAPVSGGVVNPALPFGGRQRPPGELPFSTSGYFGLAEHVDLRTRGVPSQEPVMRVRAHRPLLWRGMVFDHYEDSSWSRTAAEPDPVLGIPVRLPPIEEGVNRGERVVQTYELLTDTPNLIFAAAHPTEVYHAGRRVQQWDDGTVTTPTEQIEGTVYSVVSHLTLADDGLGYHDEVPRDEVLERYTQLPEDLPQRVRELAAEITRGADGPWARAQAVESWLGDNVEYSLDVTPQPPGADAIDWFLFEQKRGWCEPIASSMVVMLRSVGVPARLATGFQPGSRNPFTGWFEVRNADAHAWVEVWIEPVGWVTVDPTGAVPQAVDAEMRSSRVLAFDLVRWVVERVPPRVGSAIRSAVALVSRGATHPVTAIAVVLALIGSVGMYVRRRNAERRARPPFDRLEAMLSRVGVDRDPSQTPREYVHHVASVRPDLPEEALRRLLEAEEARRYRAEVSTGGGPHPQQDLATTTTEIEDELARVATHLRR